jgi:hypothetical protein
MASIVASFLSGIIGTGIEITVFMFAYGWYKSLTVDWVFVVAFIAVWALIFGPVSYYVTLQKEKATLDAIMKEV